MRNKGIILLAKIILIISLPVFLIFSSLHIATNDMNFFQNKYEEYNVTEVTGIKLEGLMEVTKELMDYLKGDRDDILIYEEINGQARQVFMERELLHLEDVQLLFIKSYVVRNISAILSILAIIYLFLYSKKSLAKGLIFSSLIPIGIMIVLGIIISINFYDSFTVFHKILFTNDLWLLNPKTEVLIQMYPLDFFKSISLRILIYFVTGLVASLGLGIFLKNRLKSVK